MNREKVNSTENEEEKKIEKMTPLQMFSKVQAHLLEQLEQSQNGGGDCLYRGPNGTMCAIGCLIKDEHYSFELEGRSFSGENGPLAFAVAKSCGYESGSELFSEYPFLIGTLGRLQDIHDSFTPGMWKERLLFAHEELVLEMESEANFADLDQAELLREEEGLNV